RATRCRRFCLSADHRLVKAQGRSEAVVPVYAESNAGAGFFKADPKQTAGGPNRASRRPHFNLAGLAQIDLGYLVLVILLRVDAHQHLHPGQHAVLVEPDLALVRVQAQQDELGIVLAGVPGGDERIPQPLDHRAVGIHRKLPADAGEQVMALRHERGGGAARAGQFAHQGIVDRGEEPDRAMRLMLQLRGHRPGVAVLQPVHAQHHGHVGLQRLPEFAFEFLGGGHHLLLQWPKATVGFWWMAGALAPDALAAGLDHALAIPLLAVALDVAAHGTAGNRAADRGQLLAVAAADLVADQATNHRTGSSAGDAVGILAGTGNLDLLADHAAAVAEAATLVLRAIGL